ncbi:outer membrane beta-barrel protein [Vibrio sp. SS-MA-C1-2]|uniref:outer membrane beta-barrel protein n=1 Tax=Vibrio sp. SS-MA-C1-2 TaxID=2908646 RepID=UPI001F48606F|nr:outer membrane beta-barrel protein [Vibrio sp. SS-MA-C1-2]UJF17308.1 outer membrane beta-barrel protein [Vibrio sp. SS-MA-C1-2]
MTTIKAVLPLTLLLTFPAAASNDFNWYSGLRVGGTHFSNACELGNESCDKDDIGGGLYLGYNFTDYFALETGYTYLGEAELSPHSDKYGNPSVDYKAQTIDLVGKFSTDLTSSLDLFAKAGAAFSHVETSNSNWNESESDWDLGPTFGAGLEYYFTPNFSSRLEYQMYPNVGNDDKVGESDVHFYGISFAYNFGAKAQPLVVEPIIIPEPEPVIIPKPIVKPIVKPTPITIDSLSVDLPFAFDSSRLSAESKRRLDPVIQRVNQYSQSKLFVVGHTDSRGTEAYNQQLSQERAQAVAAAISSNYSIGRNRMVIEGRGESQPVATNKTEAGRAENRRVEVYTPSFVVQPK